MLNLIIAITWENIYAETYVFRLLGHSGSWVVVIALASPGHSQMGLFLPLLYSFVVSVANGARKSTRTFRNDISHLCNEISGQYGVLYNYIDLHSAKLS